MFARLLTLYGSCKHFVAHPNLAQPSRQHLLQQNHREAVRADLHPQHNRIMYHRQTLRSDLNAQHSHIMYQYHRLAGQTGKPSLYFCAKIRIRSTTRFSIFLIPQLRPHLLPQHLRLKKSITHLSATGQIDMTLSWHRLLPRNSKQWSSPWKTGHTHRVRNKNNNSGNFGVANTYGWSTAAL